jgi:hypothetical protein
MRRPSTGRMAARSLCGPHAARYADCALPPPANAQNDYLTSGRAPFCGSPRAQHFRWMICQRLPANLWAVSRSLLRHTPSGTLAPRRWSPALARVRAHTLTSVGPARRLAAKCQVYHHHTGTALASEKESHCLGRHGAARVWPRHALYVTRFRAALGHTRQHFRPPRASAPRLSHGRLRTARPRLFVQLFVSACSSMPMLRCCTSVTLSGYLFLFIHDAAVDRRTAALGRSCSFEMSGQRVCCMRLCACPRRHHHAHNRCATPNAAN